MRPLVNLLKASDVDVFMDNDDIKYGDEWEKTLIQNIKASDRILVFWSKNAAKSDWVRREYTMAMNVAGMRVIPVPLDDTPLPDGLSKYQGVMEMRALARQARTIGDPLQTLFRFGPALILGSVPLMFMWWLIASSLPIPVSPPRAGNVTQAPPVSPTPSPTPSPGPPPVPSAPPQSVIDFIDFIRSVTNEALTATLLLLLFLAVGWWRMRRNAVMHSLTETIFKEPST